MHDKTIKILLIEDSVFATRHTEKMLDEAKSSQFDAELKCADTLSKGMKRLAEGGIDIVLLDLTLPDSDELHTFMSECAQSPKMPIVVMSGIEDETLAIEAVQKGAQDYLVKGQVDSNLLKRSILYAIERKQAEKEIRRVGEEWMLTFDSITDWVSIQDKDFKIVRANRAYADKFNMKPEELIGKPCYEVVHGTKEPWPSCPHRQTLETKKPATEEFFEPHLGIYLEIATSPTFNENGEATGTVHITKDITERKQAEGELAKHREHLEGLVRERTDELQKMVNLMAGREVRMAELKETIRKLRAQLEETGLTLVADDPMKKI